MFRYLFLTLLPVTAYSVVVESIDLNSDPTPSQTKQDLSHSLDKTDHSKVLNTPERDISNHQSQSLPHEDLIELTQSVNAILEALQQVTSQQNILNQKIDNLENHQREFMGYIHNHIVGQTDITTTEQSAQDYDVGLSLMKQNKMNAALKHWQEFIENYPDSSKIPAAYYWIGEIYYVMQKDDFAKDSYLYLINNYPDYEKSPDAMYKIGQILYNQGSKKQAESYWSKIIQVYPKSSASKLAKKQLSESRS